MNRSYHYIGLLRSDASWAKVARELLLAMLRRGITLTASELPEDRYKPDFPLPKLLQEIVRLPADRNIEFTFAAPAFYNTIFRAATRVGLLVYEGTCWPSQWLELAARYCHRIVVPSLFCRTTIIAQGFPENRVGVVPHGINPLVFHPGDRCPPGSQAHQTLLFVGTSAWRKGLHLLLEAFEKAFAPSDQIRLLIKLAPYDDESQRPYLAHSWKEHAMRMSKMGYDLCIIRSLLFEDEMAALYRSADLLCQPFRAEGFGIPLLEAMACGTPVLATDWSGPRDFVDDTVGAMISPRCLIAGNSNLYGLTPNDQESLVADVCIDELACLLRGTILDRDGLAMRGARAAERSKTWTWDRAADLLIAELEQAVIQAELDQSSFEG